MLTGEYEIVGDSSICSGELGVSASCDVSCIAEDGIVDFAE